MAVLSALSSRAGLVLQEEFGSDYNALGHGNGTSIDGYNGGIGFSGSWTNNTAGTESNPFHQQNIVGHIGGGLTRGGHTDNAGFNAVGREFSQSSLSANGATVWFSVDVEFNDLSSGNQGFAFSAASFDDNSQPKTTGNEGVGFRVASGSLYASLYKSGGGYRDGNALALSISDNGTHETNNMAYTILGKVEYGASEDTVTVWALAYNETETNLANLASSTRTASVNNTTFDTLTLQDNKAALWDNINVFSLEGAETDQDALNTLIGGAMIIPEPATVGLISMFGGAILFIRRRFPI